MNIKIEVKEAQEVFFVKVGGELDIYTVPELKKVFNPVVSEGSHNLHVDLSDLTYMDSTGLGLFVGTLKDLNQFNNELRISGANDRVMKLFEITGLSDLIQITQSGANVDE